MRTRFGSRAVLSGLRVGYDRRGKGTTMSRDWSEWAETATRGDLIQLAVRQRSINVALYRTLRLIIENKSSEATDSLKRSLDEDLKLGEFIEKLGGD